MNLTIRKNQQQFDPWIDTIIVILFILFAVIFSLARWGASYNQFVFLLSDAANIAGFAAARNSPELFAGDAILSNLDNFRVYLTIHFPILHVLADLTGNYGTAFITLLPIHVFAQLLGFYILGRILFLHRYWAILLSIITTPLVFINLGEYWGLYEDPIPRASFQSLLPYLLAAILIWGKNPRAWPWFMACAGLLVYVHPVSTPAWGFAFWLSALAFLPQNWGWTKKLAWLFSNGVIFLLVIVPFAWYYLGNYAHGATVDYERVYDIIAFRLEGFLDVRQSLLEFISFKTLLPYWVFALGFGLPTLLWLRRHQPQSLYVLGWWVTGLLFVSVFIALVDHSVARMYNRLPLQVDLVRGIRYLIPVMLIFCLWPLAELDRKFRKNRTVRRYLAIAGAVLVMSWGLVHPYTLARLFLYYQHCLNQNKLVCFQPGQAEKIEALEAVRTLTPEQSRLLVEGDPLIVRYYALRPVVYALKDGGILAYNNPEKLLTWYYHTQEMQSLEDLSDRQERLFALTEFAERLDTDYILLADRNTDQPYPPELDVVFKNDYYTLLRLNIIQEQRATSPTTD